MLFLHFPNYANTNVIHNNSNESNEEYASFEDNLCKVPQNKYDFNNNYMFLIGRCFIYTFNIFLTKCS